MKAKAVLREGTAQFFHKQSDTGQAKESLLRDNLTSV